MPAPIDLMNNINTGYGNRTPRTSLHALNDGMGVMREGNSVFIIPHVKTFSSQFNWVSRTYRFAFDEALKRGVDAAKYMRNDAFLQGLYRSRIMPVAKSEWRIECTGPDASEELADFYTKLLKQTPLWHDQRRSILECVWYGRYAIQMAHDSQTHEGRAITVDGEQAIGISDWVPHLGDKITWTFDRKPCIRVNPMYSSRWMMMGATILPPEDPSIIQEGAYVKWSEVGPVVVLDTPEIREKFAISVFEVQDAPWDEPDLAGGVRGIGLRHYSFWAYDTRQEIVGWAMQYLEDFGAGGYTVIAYDGPEGLAAAKSATQDPAKKIMYVPIVPGLGERVTDTIMRLNPQAQGNDAIQRWAQDYFDNSLSILYVGHPLNAGPKATGMNDDQATRAQELKQIIHKSDAEIVDGVYTYEILPYLKKQNHPGMKFDLEFISAIRGMTPDRAILAARQHFDMGGQVPAKYLHSITGVPHPNKEGEDDDVLSMKKNAEDQADAKGDPMQGDQQKDSRSRTNANGREKTETEPYTARGIADLIDYGRTIGSVCKPLADRLASGTESMGRLQAIAEATSDHDQQTLVYEAVQAEEAGGNTVLDKDIKAIAEKVLTNGVH
jgi:hypothetical protein